MSGTKAGGMKASATNRKLHGEDFYSRVGRLGGLAGRGKGYGGGFSSEKVGPDGLTGRERAVIAGAKGGRNSKRGPVKKDTNKE